MSRADHPLRVWLLAQGYGDPVSGVISADEFERFSLNYAARCVNKKDAPTGESWRLVTYGYRKPSWDLCFDVEVFTLGAVCAHDLRDDAYYAESAA